MSILRKLGLSKNSPSEVILTTYSQEKDPHAASMGIYLADNNKIRFNVFSNTQTYKNMVHWGAAAANVVTKAKLLAIGGIPEILGSDLVPWEFEAREYQAPALTNADAIIEFEIKNTRERTLKDDIGTSSYIEAIGKVKNTEIRTKNPKTLKRSDLYVLEASVLSSKGLEAKRNGKKEKLKGIIEEIKLFKKKCEKTTDQSDNCTFISKMLEGLEE